MLAVQSARDQAAPPVGAVSHPHGAPPPRQGRPGGVPAGLLPRRRSTAGQEGVRGDLAHLPARGRVAPAEVGPLGRVARLPHPAAGVAADDPPRCQFLDPNPEGIRRGHIGEGLLRSRQRPVPTRRQRRNLTDLAPWRRPARSEVGPLGRIARLARAAAMYIVFPTPFVTSVYAYACSGCFASAPAVFVGTRRPAGGATVVDLWWIWGPSSSCIRAPSAL
jgi:hypothetical protein